ncbi:fimbrial protein TcfA [Pandoraea anhela]|uniref:Fimbrial protein n=1 Tax=Pandoraea anhela TaxID=2508295 RepID=A0A5E4U677_9BURK|nr:fimbrial protein TcfA [Pandoraea anhela]VVD95576.1 hypothetical protein PAN31108_01849 [Pandoraea anhela]
MSEARGHAQRTWLAGHLRHSAMAAALLASTWLSMSAPATANVTISPIASAISGDRSQVSVIRITSQSPQTQYVEVTVKRIVDPATDGEHEVPVSLERGDGLVASPAKFVLAGGATRQVRVVSLGRPAVETAYRVYFRPVSATGAAQDTSNQTDFDSDVQVSFVWGALVRVAPQNPSPQLARSDDNRSLKNIGNVRAHVRAVGRCTSDDDDSCEWQEVGRSVYPGQTHALPDTLHNAQVRIRYLVDSQTGAQVMDLPLAP